AGPGGNGGVAAFPRVDGAIAATGRAVGIGAGHAAGGAAAVGHQRTGGDGGGHAGGGARGGGPLQQVANTGGGRRWAGGGAAAGGGGDAGVAPLAGLPDAVAARRGAVPVGGGVGGQGAAAVAVVDGHDGLVQATRRTGAGRDQQIAGAGIPVVAVRGLGRAPS